MNESSQSQQRKRVNKRAVGCKRTTVAYGNDFAVQCVSLADGKREAFDQQFFVILPSFFPPFLFIGRFPPDDSKPCHRERANPYSHPALITTAVRTPCTRVNPHREWFTEWRTIHPNRRPLIGAKSLSQQPERVRPHCLPRCRVNKEVRPRVMLSSNPEPREKSGRRSAAHASPSSTPRLPSPKTVPDSRSRRPSILH
jgi:hypothetical protein